MTVICNTLSPPSERSGTKLILMRHQGITINLYNVFMHTPAFLLYITCAGYSVTTRKTRTPCNLARTCTLHRNLVEATRRPKHSVQPDAAHSVLEPDAGVAQQLAFFGFEQVSALRENFKMQAIHNDYVDVDIDEVPPTYQRTLAENLLTLAEVIETRKRTKEQLILSREHYAVMEHLFTKAELHVESFSLSKCMKHIAERQLWLLGCDESVRQENIPKRRILPMRANLFLLTLLDQIDEDMTDGVYKLCMAHKLGTLMNKATEFDHSKSLCFGVAQMFMLISIIAGQLVYPKRPLGNKPLYLRWCTAYVDDYSPINPVTGKRFDFGPDNVFCTDYLAYLELCLNVYSEAKEGRDTDDLGCELLLCGSGHYDKASNKRRYSVEALAKATAFDLSKYQLARKGSALIYGEMITWNEGKVCVNDLDVYEHSESISAIRKSGLLQAIQFLYYIWFYQTRKLVLIWEATFEERDAFMTRESWLSSTVKPIWHERLLNFSRMVLYDWQSSVRPLRRHFLNPLAYENVREPMERGPFTIVTASGGTFLDLHDGCSKFKTTDGRNLRVEQHNDEVYLTAGKIPRWVSVFKGGSCAIGVPKPIKAEAKLDFEFDRIYVHRKMGTAAVLEVMMAQYHRPDVIMYAMSLIRDRKLGFRRGSATFLYESCRDDENGMLLQPALAGSILNLVDVFVRPDDNNVYLHVFGVFLRLIHLGKGTYRCVRDEREFGFLRGTLTTGADEIVVV